MLEEADLSEFLTKGYVILRNAFPKDVADRCREEILWPAYKDELGICRDKPESWPSRAGLKQTHFPNQEDPSNVWNGVLTERLLETIDQLVGGREKWVPENLGFGWWAASFPQQPEGNQQWSADGKWHVDGFHFSHHANSKDIGLILLALFSDIEPFAGGTAIAVGSHIEVARILLEHDQGNFEGRLDCCNYEDFGHGLSDTTVSRLALQVPGILESVEEVRGVAGDIAILHPFTLHARGQNFGTKGVDSVRFICNPCIPLLSPLCISNEEASKATLVERPIIQAKQNLLQERPILPSSFGRRR